MRVPMNSQQMERIRRQRGGGAGKIDILPAMPIDRSVVQKTAALARIELTSEELIRAESQLGAILGYVDQLARLDVTGVEPLTHAGDFANVFRPDEPRPSLPSEAALRNAPDKAGPFFVVPKVVE